MGRPLFILDQVTSSGIPVALHGVSTVRSAAPTRSNKRVPRASSRGWPKRTKAHWVSDHLCWTGVLGPQHPRPPAAALRPRPRSRPRRSQRVRRGAGGARAAPGPREPVDLPRLCVLDDDRVGLPRSPQSAEADCGLLLDVNNVYVSAFNHGFERRGPTSTRSPPTGSCSTTWPGTRTRGTHIVDTHSGPRPGRSLGPVPPRVDRPHRPRSPLSSSGTPTSRNSLAQVVVEARKALRYRVARVRPAAARVSGPDGWEGGSGPAAVCSGGCRASWSPIRGVDRARPSPLRRPPSLSSRPVGSARRSCILPSSHARRRAERVGIYHDMYLAPDGGGPRRPTTPALRPFPRPEALALRPRPGLRGGPPLASATPSIVLGRSSWPSTSHDRAADLPRRAFCRDLARLELGDHTRLFDAPETRRPYSPRRTWRGSRPKRPGKGPVLEAHRRLPAPRPPTINAEPRTCDTLRGDDHDHPLDAPVKPRRGSRSVRRDYSDVPGRSLTRPAHRSARRPWPRRVAW